MQITKLNKIKKLKKSLLLTSPAAKLVFWAINEMKSKLWHQKDSESV
jgi:hypothetical protein